MNITPEDIAAMRRDGSLHEFLRHQITNGRPTPAPAPVAEKRDPDHVLGAWPVGTRPPTAPAPVPAEEWEQALEEYRRWFHGERTEGNYGCECPACRSLTGGIT